MKVAVSDSVACNVRDSDLYVLLPKNIMSELDDIGRKAGNQLLTVY